MTDDERTELITHVKHGDPGQALLEYLAIRQRQLLTEVSLDVDPNNSGMVGRKQGALIELTALEGILQADFITIAERLEIEEAA